MKDYKKLINQLELIERKLADINSDNVEKIHIIRIEVAKVTGTLMAWDTFQDIEAKEMGKHDNG